MGILERARAAHGDNWIWHGRGAQAQAFPEELRGARGVFAVRE